MKIFKLICNDLGYKFSFNAKNINEATAAVKSWCSYHSCLFTDYIIEQTNETTNIHNEYFI